MMTNKQFEELMWKDYKQLDKKRLGSNRTIDEKEKLWQKSMEKFKSINAVIWWLNHNLVLSFKTNNYLWSLDWWLGAPLMSIYHLN